jgi:regulator of chromosome condensation
MGLTTEGSKKTPIQFMESIITVDIASGSDHLVILAQNGNVFTMGCGEQGQLGRVSSRTLTGESRRGTKTLLTPEVIPKKAGKFVATAIWVTTSCTFLREYKTNLIYAFGLNNYNQLGVAKKANEFENFPQISTIKNVKAIAGGLHHTIVLTNDNEVLAIGRKDYGRLGLGEVASDVTELKPITSLSNQEIVEIACGESNSFAVSKDGKLFVWGMGTSSQLGTGNEDDVTEPKVLLAAEVKAKKVLAVQGGGQHSLFVVHNQEASKPAKLKQAEASQSQTSSSIVETKQNGNSTKGVVAGGKTKDAKTVINDIDSSTNVDENMEKEEKMEVNVVRSRAKKRKA